MAVSLELAHVIGLEHFDRFTEFFEDIPANVHDARAIAAMLWVTDKLEFHR